jgi:glycosyltransferase involved in cell wall biosynthesis
MLCSKLLKSEIAMIPDARPRLHPDRPPLLSIVIPCFNEEEVLYENFKRINALIARLTEKGLISDKSGIWYVDDGSRDNTWRIITELSGSSDGKTYGIKLSRNRGHQAALLAGLMSANGDAIVSIDADLQDDPDTIEDMVVAYRSGAEIVYGVRSSRDADTAFKRHTAEFFYRIMALLGVELVFNHADFRLMGRHAIEALRSFKERNLFLRGIIPQLGFQSVIVEFERGKRFAGSSKYPLRKMISLAWQGATSFSATPLRTITTIGVMVSLTSILFGVWAVIAKFVQGDTVPGWASIVIPLALVSGVQLLALGIIGEYIAKIFIETKGRPHFFIESIVGGDALIREAGGLDAGRELINTPLLSTESASLQHVR